MIKNKRELSSMKKILLSSFMIVAILALVACGGQESSGSENNGGTESTVDLNAKNWQFDKDTYTVPAGKVTFNLKNEEGYHGIIVEGTDVKIDGDGSATATLEPGEYTVKCNIQCGTGHEQMTATVVVE
jgi:cytochrome c oxidase subunit II